MSKKAPKPKETPKSSNDDERQRKRDKGKEIFAKMAKVKTYPIDNRPLNPTDYRPPKTTKDE